jgi:L-2-hydroxyglutarate oxidase LhgO
VERFDHIIIGAGIIGLAIAYKLSLKAKPGKILLIEAQSQFGSETSSRNSEVIHAGIYYSENSLKATLCYQGKEQLYNFCRRYNVPHRTIGKLIIANGDQELASLASIQKNARRNGIELTLFDQAQCLTLEPNVNACGGLYSPTTGIIDSHSYMRTLLTLAEQQGVLYSPNTQFLRAVKQPTGYQIGLNTQDGEYNILCQSLINTSGLNAPEVANNIDALNKNLIPKYHYCRGHYFSYTGKSPFSHLIYPVPTKNTAGLGIHATLDLSGQVRFGPDTQYIETQEYGFDDQFEEQRKSSFIHAIKRYYPNLKSDNLHPSYSGIRPKLSAANEQAKDFIIQDQEQHKLDGLINLFGIESPGLTASLAIADYVVDKVDV